jgi:hypothetical protein
LSPSSPLDHLPPSSSRRGLHLNLCCHRGGLRSFPAGIFIMLIVMSRYRRHMMMSTSYNRLPL